MKNSLVMNSHLLEYIALACSFFHCFILLFNPDPPLEFKVLLYFFVLLNLFIAHYFRGTRVHLWPQMSGFAFYSVALLFEFLEEITLYYYYLTTLISIMLVYFFGSTT